MDIFAGRSGLPLVIADHLIFGPDGNLYVSSNLSHQVLRYDGETGESLGAFVEAGPASKVRAGSSLSRRLGGDKHKVSLL